MKNLRGALMLAVALASGLGASVAASRWVLARGGDESRIAVAAADVEIGARVTPEMVKLVVWPQASVPPGAFRTAEALQGRVVKTSVARGEPLIEAKLAPQGTKGGLSAVVSEGKRAMTVRVNDVVGVAGFALPGNYVDIMVNTQADSGRQKDQDKTISKIVLERILVLAVAQEASRDETKPRVVNAVTLEVSPQQAEQLDLARSVGTLSLVLRNQVDPQPGATEGATKTSLLLPGRPAAPAPAPRPRAAPRPVVATASDKVCVQVVRGASLSNECF